ncbi:hypothetical protein ACFVIM_13830 [Streptomyces sp. NPDC057638]|uniref:hypothetical protein n=1 Tax=Streptomyces sp. NPDC057638 TaxID=3346190 RepID=UPI0036B34E94
MGNGFDLVVSGWGTRGWAVFTAMRRWHGHPGPVVADPAADALWWFVPPGTKPLWSPHRYGVCYGPGSGTLLLPPHDRLGPRGPAEPYWLSPWPSLDVPLVHPVTLRLALEEHCPALPPVRQNTTADVLAATPSLPRPGPFTSAFLAWITRASNARPVRRDPAGISCRLSRTRLLITTEARTPPSTVKGTA